MPAEWHEADAVGLLGLPLAMKPGTSHDEVGVVGIVFFGVAKDLPRTPRVFLVPEAGDVEVRHGGGVQLVDPGFLLPELVIVGMLDTGFQ